jgi:hypothetical protein
MAPNDPGRSLAAQVGRLQSAAGNQAVAALLASGSRGAQRLPSDQPTARPRNNGPDSGLMRIGSRGPAVRALQGRLGVSADGLFGAQTRVAVIRFQQGARLSADGIVGPATRAALAGSTRPLAARATRGEATAALVAQRLGAIVARLRELETGTGENGETDQVQQIEPSLTNEVVDETIGRNDWLDDAGDWIDETTESAGDAWDEATEWVDETVDEVSGTAGDVWDEATEWVDETVDEVSGTAGDVWDEATEWVDETVDEVSGTAGDVWDEATEWVDETVDEVSGTAGDVWDEATEWVDETVDEVSGTAGDVWDEASDLAGEVLDDLGDVADEVFDTIGQLADSVRELVADPIGALSDIVDDLMGSGPSADILERLTEVWNGLFGGNDDKAETTGSGTIASVGPSVVPHACPRGDASDTGRPMSLKVQLDWGPPTIDGPSSEIAERAAGRDDKVQASVTYRGFISQTLPAANIPGFGREEPSLTVESIHWDQSNGVVEVRAYARLDCRWGINAHGRIDIPNADVPAVDEITWSHVIDDLTPGGGDKPPRLMYWASDATSAHEYYHAIDDYGAGESMVSGGDAVSTVNNRQIVDPEAELPAIMQEIHARIYQHLQDHYRSGGESRAYAATAPMFHERVAAIRARAEREGWT